MFFESAYVDALTVCSDKSKFLHGYGEGRGRGERKRDKEKKEKKEQVLPVVVVILASNLVSYLTTSTCISLFNCLKSQSRLLSKEYTLLSRTNTFMLGISTGSSSPSHKLRKNYLRVHVFEHTCTQEV